MAHKPPQASAAPIPFGEADTAEGARSAVVHPFPIGDTPYRPYIRPHRLAQATYDEGMIAALFERTKGPPRHINIDDPLVGPNQWASDEPRVRWTTWAGVLVAVSCVLIFAAQFFRDHFERLFG